MQIRYLRLVCRSRDSDDQMYLDAPVETTEDGNAIVAKAMMCGFMRNEGGDLYPFVLRKDKSDQDEPRSLGHLVDFGTDYEDPKTRYYNTNLPSKGIQIAEQFTVRWYEDGMNDYVDKIFVIREIIDLLQR